MPSEWFTRRGSHAHITIAFHCAASSLPSVLVRHFQRDAGEEATSLLRLTPHASPLSALLSAATLAARITAISEHTMYAAAVALAAQVCWSMGERECAVYMNLAAMQVTDADLARGSVFPPLSQIREVSARVAVAVATDSYNRGVAGLLPRPDDIDAHVRATMWSPEYSAVVPGSS